MNALLNSYKRYLGEYQEFINHGGEIDWSKFGQLLTMASRFEAHRIRDMKIQKQMKLQPQDSSIFDAPQEVSNSEA